MIFGETRIGKNRNLEKCKYGKIEIWKNGNLENGKQDEQKFEKMDFQKM